MLATIISRTGDMVVIDVGRKAIGIDRTPPEVVGDQGEIRIEYGQHFIHEEHIALELVPGSPLGDRRSCRADARATAPTTVNLYDFYYVVDGDRIVDVWPIHARYGSATAGVGPVPA